MLFRSFLRQRRAVKADARAYVRPGWRPPAATGRSKAATPIGDQVEAVNALRTFIDHRAHQVFVLTGPAGSGKTMLIGEVARHALQSGRTVTLCAPTGQAARRLALRTELPAQTVHSALYSSPTTDDRGDEMLPLTRFQLSYLGSPNDLMIIDESSLIGDEKVDNTDETDLLFGEGRLLSDIIEAVVVAGGQVLFVGDDHQLAPVGSDHLPALDAETLSRRGLTVAGASLTQVHRQEEGSDILDLAQGCRASVDTGEPLPPLPTHIHSAVQHLANKSDAPHWLLEASWRGEAMVIAARHVDAGNWITRVRAHQGASPHQPERGDRLVLVRGDFSIGLLNGDEVTVVEHLGQETVHHVKHRDRSVTLHTLLLETVTPMGTTTRFVGRVIDDLLLRADQQRMREASETLFVDFVVRMRSENIKRGSQEFLARMREDSRMVALYCMYSYARTAHRAQGGEWDVVICDFSKTALRRTKLGRYAYTAVTRARRTLWISNWPTPPPIDAAAIFEELVRQVTTYLRHAGSGPVKVTPLPTGLGVTIRREPDDKTLVVDVFHTLTIQTPQKWPPTMGSSKEMLSRFGDWRRLLKPPMQLDDNALEWLRPRLDSLDEQGIEVDLLQKGQYEIWLTAQRNGLTATFRLSHKDLGECTIRDRMGDTSLIAEVDAAIGAKP